jgi:hypothetical protein
MKSPESILDFTQQSWFIKAKQVQQLQADCAAALEALGFMQSNQCELFLNLPCLTIKSNAALLTRIRQIEPAFLNELVIRGWQIESLKCVIVKHATALSNHLKQPVWTNPNELRYGKRSLPTQEQRALIWPAQP